jgi:hypothetical protein
MKISERNVNLNNEIENHIRNRHADISGEKIMYRTIGFSLHGTHLFDFKNEVSVGARFICKIKPDFLS